MSDNNGDLIERLRDEIDELVEQGKYAQALPLGERLCNIAATYLDLDDPEYSDSISTLAELNQHTGNYKEAEKLFQEVIELDGITFGTDHTHYASDLMDLADLYVEMREYLKADPLYRQALEIDLEELGETSEIYQRELEKVEGFCHLLSEHLKRLNLLAGNYAKDGDFAAAEPLYQEALDIEKCLQVLERALRMQPVETYQDEEQARWAKKSLDQIYQTGSKPIIVPHEEAQYANELRQQISREFTSGENPSDVGRALDLYNQGVMLLHVDFQSAKYMFEQAIEITSRFREFIPMADMVYGLAVKSLELGQNEADLQEESDNLADEIEELFDQGRYKDAIGLAIKAVELAKRQFGEDHEDYAEQLCGLAEYYFNLGDYAAAEPLFVKVIEIMREAVGEDDADFAGALLHLAKFYCNTGRMEEVQDLIVQIQNIYQETSDADDPEYADYLSSVATLHFDSGDYSAAEPLFRQALEIYRKSDDEDCQDGMIYCASSLAVLLTNIGDYEGAKHFHWDSIGKYLDVEDDETPPALATGLLNLTRIYQMAGDFEHADTLCKKAINILRAAYGEEHPEYAQGLLGLGYFYYNKGMYAANDPASREALTSDMISEMCLVPFAFAKIYSKRAVDIFQGTTGRNSGQYLSAIAQYTMVCWAMGEYDEAESILSGDSEGKGTVAKYMNEGLLSSARKVFHETHPINVSILNILTMLYVATGRDFEALKIIKDIANIQDRLIVQVFSGGSERQRLTVRNVLQDNFDSFLSLVSGQLSNSPEAVNSALELILKRKAIGVEILSVQRDAVLGDRYPQLKQKLAELNYLRSQIINKQLNGPGVEGVEGHVELMIDWERQREQLEKELARQIPEMNIEERLRNFDYGSISPTLPNDATLVEFVKFNFLDFKAVPSKGQRARKSPRYLAFVITAGEVNSVKMIDLGEAEEIDKLLADFRAEITGEIENHRGVTGEKDLRVKPGAGGALRGRVFDPLKEALGNNKHLLLSPDGNLARLPFEVLPIDRERYLIDEYRISYLSTGRDVMRFRATIPFDIKPAASLVVADPDFDLTGFPTAALAFDQPDKESRSLRAEVFVENRIQFGRLIGTQIEGQRIAELLDAPFLTGKAALEAKIKSSASPFILHLATHGFFFPDQVQRSTQGIIDGQALLNDLEANRGRFASVGVLNPLLRSGIALAGVNTWLNHGHLPIEAEDGILTAEDVSALDLRATELAVLSACETGLGDVLTGEGVFGLRRAFVLAGAKTLVMSLWKVPDLPTAILMERFYTNLLTEKMNRDEALREAQLFVRNVTVKEIRDKWLTEELIECLAAGDVKSRRALERLATKSDERPFVDTRNWGAFICQGATDKLIQK